MRGLGNRRVLRTVALDLGLDLGLGSFLGRRLELAEHAQRIAPQLVEEPVVHLRQVVHADCRSSWLRGPSCDFALLRKARDGGLLLRRLGAQIIQLGRYGPENLIEVLSLTLLCHSTWAVS